MPLIWPSGPAYTWSNSLRLTRGSAESTPLSATVRERLLLQPLLSSYSMPLYQRISSYGFSQTVQCIIYVDTDLYRFCDPSLAVFHVRSLITPPTPWTCLAHLR